MSVPAIQKHIIRRAAEYLKPIITATQMLESMIDNPRPTRAEASDVANAIYDGTDAVMLSAESAAGKYPVESVAMMAKIVIETEHQIRLDPRPALGVAHSVRLSIAETICECMSPAADDLTSLPSPSSPRPAWPPPTLEVPPRPAHLRPLALREGHQPLHAALGTYPILCDRFRDTDKLVNMAEEVLEKGGHVQPRQIVGIVAGTRTKSGATNFMRLHMVGDRDLTLAKAKPKPKKKK